MCCKRSNLCFILESYKNFPIRIHLDWFKKKNSHRNSDFFKLGYYGWKLKIYENIFQDRILPVPQWVEGSADWSPSQQKQWGHTVWWQSVGSVHSLGQREQGQTPHSEVEGTQTLGSSVSSPPLDPPSGPRTLPAYTIPNKHTFSSAALHSNIGVPFSQHV